MASAEIFMAGYLGLWLFEHLLFIAFYLTLFGDYEMRFK